MISIVIPAHNEEGVIGETLRRLREGARAAGVEVEIILSDDGSTDKTADVAAGVADFVVRYAGQQPKTIGAARNRGAAIARGDILMFLDSDVWLRDPHTFFPAIIQHFESNQKLVAMTVSMRVEPTAETRADRFVLSCFDAYFRFANNVLHWGLTHGKCMIVRTTAYKQVGGINEHLIASEDADLFMRLSKVGRTLLDSTLRVYFSGRRAHVMGWPKLLWQWTLNGIWIVVFKKSYSQNWARAKGS